MFWQIGVHFVIDSYNFVIIDDNNLVIIQHIK